MRLYRNKQIIHIQSLMIFIVPAISNNRSVYKQTHVNAISTHRYKFYNQNFMSSIMQFYRIRLKQVRSISQPDSAVYLTHWGRVMHICVSKLTIIGSDNGLSPGRRQTIIWTNAGILLIRTLGINFSEIWSEIHTFSSKKIYLKMSSGKWRPLCLGFNVLTLWWSCIFAIFSWEFLDSPALRQTQIIPTPER